MSVTTKLTGAMKRSEIAGQVERLRSPGMAVNLWGTIGESMTFCRIYSYTPVESCPLTNLRRTVRNEILTILLLLCYRCGGHGTGLEKSGVMLPLLSLITFPFASIWGA